MEYQIITFLKFDTKLLTNQNLITIMKKNRIKRRSLFMGIVMMIVVGSCQKNEFEYENVSGILTFRFQLLDGRVFDCTVDQPAKTIQNDLDSLLFGTSSATLAKLKPIFTTTIGAQVFVNGTEIKSGESEIDLNQPIKITTRFKDAQREYSVKAFVEKVDHSQTSGAKINTDMRMTGLPSFNSYSAAWFNNKLYILGAYYPNGTASSGTAYYELYSSDDGGLWTKVETNPKIIGGFGAELAVMNGKLYAIGGVRMFCKDINGTAPDASSTSVWRMMSTTNGTDWTDCTSGQVGNPLGRPFPQIVVHNGQLYLRRGKSYSFGMWQAFNQTNIYCTSDGTNWTSINATPTTVTNRNEDAMYSFGGKLWISGGYVGYISESNVKGDIYSSSDNGLTWVAETATGVDLNRFGHKVVSYNGKLYMIGGEKVVGTTRIGLTSVLSSTDGKNWTALPSELQLPSAFTPRIYPNVINGKDDLVWIIGGFANSAGNYTINGINMNVRFDAWTKRLR